MLTVYHHLLVGDIESFHRYGGKASEQGQKPFFEVATDAGSHCVSLSLVDLLGDIEVLEV